MFSVCLCRAFLSPIVQAMQKKIRRDIMQYSLRAYITCLDVISLYEADIKRTVGLLCKHPKPPEPRHSRLLFQTLSEPSDGYSKPYKQFLHHQTLRLVGYNGMNLKFLLLTDMNIPFMTNCNFEQDVQNEFQAAGDKLLRIELNH